MIDKAGDVFYCYSRKQVNVYYSELFTEFKLENSF